MVNITDCNAVKRQTVERKKQKKQQLYNSSTSEQQEGKNANQEKPSTNKMYSHKINK